MAAYNMPGGTVVTDTGEFYDTGGPTGDYSDFQDITTTFTCATAGGRMRLVFTAFSTEASYDYLRVYDGPSTASPQLGAYHGINGPSIVVGSGESLTFRFTSDSSVVRPGWAATIEPILPATVPEADPPPHNDVGIVFEAGTGPVDGAGRAVLPALRVIAHQVEADRGLVFLPALRMVGTGSLGVHGAGLSVLPTLQVRAHEAAGNHVVVTLPALVALGHGGALLAVPNSGSGLMILPALAVTVTGFERQYGDAVLGLPALRVQAYEVPGNHAVLELPALETQSFQALTFPDSYAALLAQPTMSVLGSDKWVLRDGMTMTETQIATAVSVLIERLRTTGSPLPNSERYAALSDGARFADALAVAWRVMVAEGVDLIGAATGSPNKLAVIVDSLHATGVVATRKDALAVVVTVLAVNGMLATGWKMEAIDTADFRDALVGSLSAITALVDGAGFADLAGPSLRLTAIMGETLDVGDDPATRMDLLAALTEDVLFYGTIRLGASEYVGWVLNEGAPSEYTNYPFNGFVAFDNRYFGTSDNGLFLLDGATDAGEPIQTRVRTALMDFGTGVLKHIPDVYVAFAGGNRLVLKVITTDPVTNAQVENHYNANVPGGTALHNGRVKVGQGLRSRYWQFELVNVNGADFDLDELSFRPMMLDRRM